MKHKFLFVCFFVLTPPALIAQINNQLLETSIEVNDSLQKQVLLNIESNSFFKNNEYFGKISTGYTLFGSRLNTQIAYLPNPYVRLQAGVLLQKDFGNDTALQSIPLFSCKIMKNGYSALIGTLEGQFSHRLIEPLYNYERFITHPVENGIQLKIDRYKIWSETWINWEVMQYAGDTRQEQFTVGHSSDITLFKNERVSFSLPLQGMVTHKGGQIDIDTTALRSIANAAIGISFSWRPGGDGFVKKVSTDNYFCFFTDLSPSKRLNFSQGQGTYLNATLQSKYDVSFSTGYWNGNDYLASRGGYLFQSEASPYGVPGYIQNNRSLIFLRLLYQHRVFDAVNIDVRFEPYYDIGSALFEYNYSVYFSYKSNFTLINFLKRK